MKEILMLNGESLTIRDTVRVARGTTGEYQVQISEDSRERIVRTREYIEKNWMTSDAPPIYGFTTGLGKLKDTRISPQDNERFQYNTIMAVCGGLGEPLPEDVVRAAMLIRVNLFCTGVCGIRIEAVDRLLEMLNRGVHPVVPTLGSVGCSGDLPPLAHIVSVMIGHERAEAFYQGKRMAARAALEAAGMEPEFTLKAKDALSLINGTTVFAGYAALNVHDAAELVKMADVTGALSLEAVRGELNAFDPRYQVVGRHPGQRDVAANILQLVQGSTRCTDEARMVHLKNDILHPEYSPRIQDVLSLRCMPQVHGAVRDNLAYVSQTIERELNAVTDNPLVFWNDAEQLDFCSGGNSHGEPIGFAMDILCMSIADLGNIAERRVFMLCDPTLSYGIPPMLAGEPAGVNCGYPVISCAAAALASENKTLSFPSTADSITTKSSQEDHVSMAPWAARKARMVLKNFEKILAIETLIATQAISMTEAEMPAFILGDGTRRAYEAVRREFSATNGDEYMPDQSGPCVRLVETRALLKAAEGPSGSLK